VPQRCCGKLVVATSHDQEATLQKIFERASAKGVEDIELIGAPQRHGAERPRHMALLSGSTGIIDGHALKLAYQGDAENAGATVQCRTQLLGGTLGSSAKVSEIGDLAVSKRSPQFRTPRREGNRTARPRVRPQIHRLRLLVERWS